MGKPENEKVQKQNQADEVWKKIVITCEPRAKDFTLGIEKDTKVQEIIEAVEEQCREENLDMGQWKKKQTGDSQASLVLIRKSDNSNDILPPETILGDLEGLQDGEIFDLKVRPLVG